MEDGCSLRGTRPDSTRPGITRVRATPYRFSPEQLGRLDAHFGAREVWLPMELDELVAALVEAQALEMELPWGIQRALFQLTSGVAKRRHEGGRHVPSSHQADCPERPAHRGRQEGVPWCRADAEEGLRRAHLGRVTVGYLYPSPNGGKSAVETPIGDGKYAYQTITNAAELKKAIAAMKAVEKRAAKKAASKAKAK